MAEAGSKRPILLLSLPRAGSTWMANVLSHSVGVRYVSEPADAYLWPAAFWAKFGLGEYPTPNDALVSKRFQRLWATVLDHPSYFNDKRCSAQLLSRIYSPLIRRAVSPHRTLNAGSNSRRKKTYAAPLSEQSCHERLLVKEVTISLCGGLIADWLDAEVLVLRRDPMKVAASWLKMGFPPEPIHRQSWVVEEVIQPLGIKLPPLDTHAEKLAWTVGLLDLTLVIEAHKRKWPLVNHEQLVDNPRGEFQKMVELFGLVPTGEMWSFLEQSGKSEGSNYSINRTAEQIRNSSKGVFSASDQIKIESVLDELANHFPTVNSHG